MTSGTVTSPTSPTSAIEGQATPPAGQAESQGWSPWELAIHEVESEVADVCGHVHSLYGRLVGLVGRVLAESLWSQHGVRSPEHWVCWQTGLSPSVARRLVAAARRRDELPATLAALEAGELSLDQVTPIVELAPAWADEQLCALAKQCTVTQIRAAVRRYPFDEEGGDEPGSDPATDPGEAGDTNDGTEDPGAGSEPTAGPGAEHVRWVQLDDGTWQLSARLGLDDGLVVDPALREITDALFADLGRLPTGAETLVELAHRALDSVEDRSRRDRYRVHVMLDEHHDLVDPYGHSLPGWLRDLICCDATMAVTWTRHGRPIAQGSTADVIPATPRPAPRRAPLEPRNERSIEPGLFVSGASPDAPPRPTRHPRQRRHPRRAPLHRPPRTRDRHQPAHPSTQQPTTHTTGHLPPPTRRTPPPRPPPHPPATPTNHRQLTRFRSPVWNQAAWSAISA